MYEKNLTAMDLDGSASAMLPLGLILQALGHRLLDDIQQLREDFALLDRRIEPVTAAGLPGLLLELEPGETDIPRFLKDWIALRHSESAFYITLNRRGGTGLTRWGDSPPLDFRLLRDHPDLLFIHSHKGNTLPNTLII